MRPRRPSSWIVLALLLGTVLSESAYGTTKAIEVVRLSAPDLAREDTNGELQLCQITWGHLERTPLASINKGELSWSTLETLSLADDRNLQLKVVLRLSNGRAYVGRDIAAQLRLMINQRDIQSFSHALLSSLPGSRALGEGEYELPRYQKRRLHLLMPDGSAAESGQVTLNLFLSKNNHCGIVVGEKIFEGSSNSEGVIEFEAPPGVLWLERSLLKATQGNEPITVPFTIHHGVLVHSETDMDLIEDWEPKPEKYAIELLHLSVEDSVETTYSAHTALSGFTPCGAWDGELTLKRVGSILHGSEILKAVKAITLLKRKGNQNPQRYRLSDAELSRLRVEKYIRLADIRWTE